MGDIYRGSGFPQTKFEAASMLPEPLYFATFG
jgi:hypothetical protein